jgi:hypothetical protein
MKTASLRTASALPVPLYLTYKKNYVLCFFASRSRRHEDGFAPHGVGTSCASLFNLQKNYVLCVFASRSRRHEDGFASHGVGTSCASLFNLQKNYVLCVFLIAAQASSCMPFASLWAKPETYIRNLSTLQ